MAKLYFKYSTMNAGKSIDLIRSNYNYRENRKNTICLTSGKDDRYGIDKITSRIGISIDAISIIDNDNLFNIIKEYKNISCVFIDEVQFFTKEQIFQLSDVVDILNIPVLCYGLRSDFQMKMFPASETLMAIADEINEIKTMCSYCGDKKAIINARYTVKEGMIGRIKDIITEGEQVLIGGNDSYMPLCRKCYKELLELTKKRKEKDTSIIPKGIYCYDDKKTCPYYDKKEDGEIQANGYCHYIEKGDLELNDEMMLEDPKTGEMFSPNQVRIPGGLLFDMCKECDINDEYDENE